jgi:acetylornithine deacetylase/succinyl-diaminopimelate desuccinylase-like protein
MEVRQLETTPNDVSDLGKLAGSNPAAARANGGIGSLLFYAHLDTVPAGDERNWRFPPFSATVAEDGHMYGRGVKDCKLGMASALAAASALRDAGITLSGDLFIVTPCDEETGGHLGIASMIDAGWLDGIEACIFGEGMPEQLTIGAKGGIELRVTVRGKSAHTSRKDMGVNAILQAAAVVQAIEAIRFDDCTEHPVVPGGPIASVNLISGDFKLNVVPDTCTLDVGLRFPPSYTADQVLAHVQRTIDDLRAQPEHRDLDVEISILAVMRPYAMDPNQPVVQALGMAVESVTGKAPAARGMVASSDACWIYLDAHIPTVNFSFGNESAHLPNEWVDVEGYIANSKASALTNLLLSA